MAGARTLRPMGCMQYLVGARKSCNLRTPGTRRGGGPTASRGSHPSCRGTVASAARTRNRPMEPATSPPARSMIRRGVAPSRSGVSSNRCASCASRAIGVRNPASSAGAKLEDQRGDRIRPGAPRNPAGSRPPTAVPGFGDRAVRHDKNNGVEMGTSIGREVSRRRFLTAATASVIVGFNASSGTTGGARTSPLFEVRTTSRTPSPSPSPTGPRTTAVRTHSSRRGRSSSTPTRS